MKLKRMTIGAAAAALAAGLLSAGPVAADPPEESGVVTREMGTVGYFYSDGEVIVLTGPPFEEGCVEENFPPVVASVVQRGDGETFVHFQADEIPIMVFEGNDPFALLDQGCGAVLDDDPSTNPPEPIAMGIGRHSVNETFDENGAHIRNSINGRVTFTDGSEKHVKATASFDVGPGGLQNLKQRIQFSN